MRQLLQHEGKQSLVKHFYVYAVLFCIAVSIYVVTKSPVLGVGAFSTFFSILLFAGQMLSRSMIDKGNFKNWARNDKVVFVLSFIGAAITIIAFAVALPTMFKTVC